MNAGRFWLEKKNITHLASLKCAHFTYQWHCHRWQHQLTFLPSIDNNCLHRCFVESHWWHQLQFFVFMILIVIQMSFECSLSFVLKFRATCCDPEVAFSSFECIMFCYPSPSGHSFTWIRFSVICFNLFVTFPQGFKSLLNSLSSISMKLHKNQDYVTDQCHLAIPFNCSVFVHCILPSLLM